MKTYFFRGYFLNGKGNLYSLCDWTFVEDNFYFPHSRELKKLDYVTFDFEEPKAGMYRAIVDATGLKEALSFLRFSLIANDLSLVLSADYECLSNGKLSCRINRLPLDDV